MYTVAAQDMAYEKFRKIYDRAVDEIDAVRTADPSTSGSDEEVRSIAAIAIGEMAGSKYGRPLMSDVDLCGVLSELEQGLCWYSDNLDFDSSGSIWADVDNVPERALRFWGRIGGIYYHYRDHIVLLDTKREAELRLSLIRKSQDLVVDMDLILEHVAIELAYDKSVLRKMKRIRLLLKELDGELKVVPSRENESPDVNLFQAGKTILVRQFAKTVCDLCFQLFGCIRPSHLELLLARKSSTAEYFGLIPWLSIEDGSSIKRDSRRRRLDGYIRTSLNDALKKAAQQRWATEGVLKVFDKSTGAPPSDGVTEEGHAAPSPSWWR